MNTDQLEKLLKKRPETSKRFHGVFSCNTLPKIAQEGFYIANFDPDTGGGTHWIAIEITPRNEANLYFDSYGFSPYNKFFRAFLGNKWDHNTKRLQHLLSTTCGQWCLYFILRRAQGWEMNEITKPFRDQGKNHTRSIVNDHVVNYKVEELFQTDLDVIDKSYAVNEIKQLLENRADAELNAIP